MRRVPRRLDEVALSECYAEWTTLDGADAWKKKKFVEITSAEGFVDDGMKTIVIKTGTFPREPNAKFVVCFF